jgi:hypothetical protein
LPYLEQTAAYRQFHLEEPWDSPHNLRLVDQIPAIYRPIGVDGHAPGTTFIQAFVGPGTAFEDPGGERFVDPDGRTNFPDGLRATILAVEARRPVPWTAPVDLPFEPNAPLPPLGGGFRRDRRLFHARATIDDFLFLRADGSVGTASLGFPSGSIRALITRNGGEPVPPDGF